MTTIIVNKVAESIYKAMAESIPGGISVAPWDTMPDGFKAGYIHAAKAAIATMFNFVEQPYHPSPALLKAFRSLLAAARRDTLGE